jgi:hypothetical protein
MLTMVVPEGGGVGGTGHLRIIEVGSLKRGHSDLDIKTRLTYAQLRRGRR